MDRFEHPSVDDLLHDAADALRDHKYFSLATALEDIREAMPQLATTEHQPAPALATVVLP